MAKLHKAVREAVDKAGEIGWRYDGEMTGKGHPILVHENGSRYSIAATPSDYRGHLNMMSDLETIAGQKIQKNGKHRNTHRKFEGSGFSIEDAKREQAQFHRDTDILPVADLWNQRRSLIAKMVELITAGGDNVDLAAASLWKIRATERALKNMGQSVREFDLMDLPIDGKTKESVKSRVNSTPKPDPSIAALAAKAQAGKAPRKRRAKKDDFDGTLLLAETEPWRVGLMGKTYDLYLSPDNRAMIEEFLTNLTTGATLVRKTRAKKITPELTKERHIAAALAGPQAPEGHDPAYIREWLRTHGFPNIAKRGRFTQEQLDAYAKRNKRARRAFDRGLPDIPSTYERGSLVKAQPETVEPAPVEVKVAAPKPATVRKANPNKGKHFGPTTPTGANPKVIREWLRKNGWPDIADRGRFSQTQLDAYAAHLAALAAATAIKDRNQSKTGAPKKGPLTPAGVDGKAMRAWCRENGWPEIGDRGRFTYDQINAYVNRLAQSA